MNQDIRHEGHPAERLIEQLSQMSSRIQQAISALSSNALCEFEDSLWQQEMLSAAVIRSLHQLDGRAIPPIHRSALRDAALRLLSLSHSFDAVVRQGAQTSAVLSGLCSSYHNAGGPIRLSNNLSLSYEI